MKGKGKRGQAAMEFLTTYGWAILIIVIVLAALIWLGVFNVQNKVVDSCSIQPELACDPVRLVANPANPTVTLQMIRLTNRFPERISVCSIECRTGEQTNAPTQQDCELAGNKVSIGTGSSLELIGPMIGGAGLQCFDGDAPSVIPLQGNAGELLSTNIYFAYMKDSDGQPAFPARLGTAKVVTRIGGV